MAVKSVMVTTLHMDWKNGVEPEDIEQLNRDFAEMEVPLKVTCDQSADGVAFCFAKGSLDDE